MAEIRCPMCGKPNPDHLEQCQSCDARLSPLNISSSQDIETPKPVDSHSTENIEDEHNWLTQMRSDSDDQDVSNWSTEDDPPLDENETIPAEEDDWLQRIRAFHQEDQDNRVERPPDDETQADWVSQPFDTGAEDNITYPGQDEASSDWLPDDSIGGLETSPDPVVHDGAEPEQDWLSEFTKSEPESESIIQSQDEDVPDWLSDLGISKETPASETGEPGQALFSEPTEEEPDAVLNFQSQDEDTPDGLNAPESDGMDFHGEMRARRHEYPEVDSDDPQQQESENVPTSQRPGDQTPDWLKGLQNDPGLDNTGTPELAPEGETYQAGEEDLQSWLSELDKDSESEPGESISAPDEEMPGWLKSLGSVVTGTVEDTNIPDERDTDTTPFVGQDEFDEDLLDIESLPNWLTPESGTPDVDIDDKESDLADAELPGWLEAMRPVDRKQSGTFLDDGHMESAGPLAGLRAILPAEPEITHYKKPPVYSAKLKVTESQLTQADAFKKLLSVEGDTTPIPEPPLISSQRAFRWLTAIILSVVVGFIVIGGSQFIPLPSLNAIPDSTYNASRIISALPEQAPVLLAFDYEPGTAGEMHAASAALVDHLMLKAARLTLVSTLPTGPAMAEYFMQNVQHQHNYRSGLQYINLGYIPGGATGLLSFSQTPQWVFPLSYDGFYPWETLPLDGIDSLSDFSLVIIITDDSDTARTWIEQVQPQIEDTPLLTVVSAKAEPLVQPYYNQGTNPQVSGILSGLRGGAAYEVTVGRINLGRTYWDAFGISLVIAVGVIVIGGASNGIQFILARNKREKRGDGK